MDNGQTLTPHSHPHTPTNNYPETRRSAVVGQNDSINEGIIDDLITDLLLAKPRRANLIESGGQFRRVCRPSPRITTGPGKRWGVICV